jgi:hypothetical protein
MGTMGRTIGQKTVISFLQGGTQGEALHMKTQGPPSLSSLRTKSRMPVMQTLGPAHACLSGHSIETFAYLQCAALVTALLHLQRTPLSDLPPSCFLPHRLTFGFLLHTTLFLSVRPSSHANFSALFACSIDRIHGALILTLYQRP